MRSTLLLMVLLLPASLPCRASDAALPAYVAPAEQAVLTAWLSSHPDYRLAVDADCNCDKDLGQMRSSTASDYHPYHARGDFNGDRKGDFAVVFINTRENGTHYLAVFNGPVKPDATPAYLAPAEGTLSYNRRWKTLVIGEFWSEGAVLEPKGNGYELVLDDCC